jgi:hypothetical protein
MTAYMQLDEGRRRRWRFHWNDGAATRWSDDLPKMAGGFRTSDEAVKAAKAAGFGACKIGGRTVRF